MQPTWSWHQIRQPHIREYEAGESGANFTSVVMHTDITAACKSWWRHQMDTFSALPAFCAGNFPVPGEFPSQRPVTRSFAIFFDLCLNKRLSKQSWGWWFETPSCSLWRHCNVTGTGHTNIKMRFHHTVVYPNSKVHGANMGPIWGRQVPGGPHAGPMNFAIWVGTSLRLTWHDPNNLIEYLIFRWFMIIFTDFWLLYHLL